MEWRLMRYMRETRCERRTVDRRVVRPVVHARRRRGEGGVEVEAWPPRGVGEGRAPDP